MRILELGSYLVPAYAGMILAEQGHEVAKWINGRDPILGLHRGEELWRWLNQGKRLEERHPRELLEPREKWPNIILDNFRPSTLAGWKIDPEKIAAELEIRWVSMRSEMDEMSFDILAQARSWMEYAPWVPFYVGDTAAGLWMAFKALSSPTPGHFVLGHASCLQKLVEGELLIEISRDGKTPPWEDAALYGMHDGAAQVFFKNKLLREPVRDREWKLDHLWHRDGRILI